MPGEPTWEVAYLFPSQGQWSEDEYLRLNTKRLLEFSDGALEALPMPTQWHQMIVLALYRQLFQFVESRRLGLALVAPLRVKLWDGRIREPDVVFMLAEHQQRRGEHYWTGADLVMEVVSPDDPQRDQSTKRLEYAKAGIGEYWIVDPRHETIMVLTLSDGATEYRVAGTYSRGQRATSVLLEGFAVEADEVFAQP
jgi:Uma2 family endonuclease